MSNIDTILNERKKTHGTYAIHASIAQRLKDVMRENFTWNNLNVVHKEALEMIAHKIARILAGDYTYLDHWDDIAGYAELVSRFHRGENKNKQ